MKKVLLGTTAMVSVGLVAGQASAAEPIELSFGGYHNWAVFLADNDDSAGNGVSIPNEPGFNKGDHDIKFDGELQVRGKTVLDNGLEVGVRIEIEGETQGDQLDENYAYIEGSFGTFRIGNDDPASYNMATAAPYINYVFAANTPSVFANGLSQFFAQTTGLARSRFAAGASVTFATFPNQTGDDARVMYFSPVFNGFQFGASYAPDNKEARPAGVYTLPVQIGGTTTTPAFTHGETWSVGARYDGEIGDVGLTVAGGYLDVQSKAIQNAPINIGTTDSNSWNAGVVLYYGNWGLGGSYMNTSDNANVAGTDIETFDVGLSYYADGPWSAGIYWLHSETDYSAGTLAAAAVTDEFDAYRLMGQYDLGPGIAVTGAVGFDQFDDGVVNRDYDTYFGGAGLLISF